MKKLEKKKGLILKEGKITLPLIRAFQNMSESNRNQLKVVWQQAFDECRNTKKYYRINN